MTSQWWVNFDFNMANINISSPKPKVSKHYGRSCVAGTYGGIRCMNTQFTKGVSFHYFPNNAKDLKRHQQWVRFVRRHRPEFKPSTYSSLCSVHFEDSCYSVPRDAALQFGVRAKLKDDAVPSIDAANETTKTDTATPVRERRQVCKFFKLLPYTRNVYICDLSNIDYKRSFVLQLNY